MFKLKQKKELPSSSEKNYLDLGLVGEPRKIRPHILDFFKKSDITPVIAPIGYGSKGETLNINADTVAGAISAATGARRLLMLTDVVGILNTDGELIPELTVSQAQNLIKDGSITGGMIPKVRTCIDAVEKGVGGAVIIDGRVPHALLLELFTEHGAGTLITPDS